MNGQTDEWMGQGSVIGELKKETKGRESRRMIVMLDGIGGTGKERLVIE